MPAHPQTDRASEGGLLLSTVPSLLQAMGGSAESVLRRSGLPRTLFSHPPAALTPNDYFALWSAMDDEIESVGNGPLPLRLIELVSVEYFDPMIFAFLNSPNVKTGIMRNAQYTKATSVSRLRVSETATGLAIDYWWPAPLTAPPVVSLAGQVYGVWLIRLATKAHVQPVRVVSPDLPGHMDAYREFFGVPVTLGSMHRMEFGSIDIHRPLLTANDSMWQMFEPALRKRVSEVEAAGGTAEKVSAVLIELLPAGQDSIEAVAKELAVSVRTLQRQLNAEATSFQSILNETRERLALHYLRQGHLSSAQIAFLLAYDDVRSFNRAFRAWTGMSPKQAREGHKPTPSTKSA